LAIGGAENRAGGSGLLRAFAELSGGTRARIVLVTTASRTPGSSFARYSAAFHRLGVPVVRELRLAGQEEADDDRTLTELGRATGVFFSGGDQSRLQVLVGSRTNRFLKDQLAGHGLMIAGTSAGATVLGETMILGGAARAAGQRTAGAWLRTGPGLGMLPEVIVDMHFAERQRLLRLLAAVLRQPSHLGLGIDEDTAILVSPGRVDVLGRGAVTTVDAGRRRSPARLARQTTFSCTGCTRGTPSICTSAGRPVKPLTVRTNNQTIYPERTVVLPLKHVSRLPEDWRYGVSRTTSAGYLAVTAANV
jgi:cyanophycinase